MTEPLVCCVTLVNGRPEMTRRAVESYLAQTYENRVLLLWDTGNPLFASTEFAMRDRRLVHWGGMPKTIGAMRNDAIAWALDGPSPLPDIFVTFDSDDVSHERRIEEQVSLLVSSGADCVGYRECAFWDSRQYVGKRDTSVHPVPAVSSKEPYANLGGSVIGHVNEAWIYRSHDTAYAIGASLAYWRRTWERVKFPNVNIAEDRQFCARVNCVGVSGTGSPPLLRQPLPMTSDGEPRLICGIHGSNTADYSKFSTQVWRRAPELDAFCRERMAL